MNRLRTALREATRTAHERVDGLFSILDLTRRDHYARFLLAQEAALGAIEAGLDAADARAVIPDWPERKRASALRRDLDGLAQAPLPAAQAPDWIGDRASIVGAAYVLEGSRLGGKLLLKEALASPDSSVAEATRFLGHGEGRRLWPAFDALLAGMEFSDEEIGRAAESAERTFEIFEQAAVRVLEDGGSKA